MNTRMPQYIQWFYPSLLWRIPGSGKKVFLSFDDGPTPGITENILEILESYSAKACFFCLGKNVEEFSGLYDQIQECGHATGNHTYSHLNGWKTSFREYINDVYLAREFIDSRLFRPPFGRIRPSQIKALKEEFEIVMWDVLTGDYNPNVDVTTCYNNAAGKLRSGSVVVFHDSVKASETMLPVLPKLLEYYTSRGYEFLPIPQYP